MDKDIYNFTVNTAQGQPQALSDYQGQVLLIVNTASQCGFTGQYAGLQQLQERFGQRGFSVLAFPCNQFGRQEPGNNEQIQRFCQDRFGITFPVFDKLQVNGPNSHPLYQFLKRAAPGIANSEAIKWNFTKFLVDRRGQVLRRYAPQHSPAQIGGDIEDLLLTQASSA